ncbi:MAG: 4-alpha-glucanotransferase [Planctomycetota bacterium]
MTSHLPALHRLARAAGLETAYHSGLTGHTPAPPESLVALLNALGHRLSDPARSDAALARMIDQRRKARVEPVTVRWSASRPRTTLVLPTTRAGNAKATGRIEVTLKTERGETHEVTHRASDLPLRSRREADGSRTPFVVVPLVPARTRLPEGYHHATIRHAGETFRTLLIASPKVSYQTPHHQLGVFAPTYALRSRTNLGVGNLGDLERLGRWAGELGVDRLGTLPLLSVFLEDTSLFAASPYSPVSRLFFNELFIDCPSEPEFAPSGAARVAGGKRFKDAAAALRRGSGTIDYKASSALQRRLLDTMARHFFDSGGESTRAFRDFKRDSPRAERYAAFRAIAERKGNAWWLWGERDAKGQTRRGDEPARRTHLYAQFALARRLGAIAAGLDEHNSGLYLDLAVGSHPAGFDTFDNRRLFVPGASVGAPADPTYTSGQNWGFQPVNPQRSRAEGHRYFIESLRAQMRVARTLRLDHVMAMHRLFVIPPGAPASAGAYLRYPCEEHFAILSLESHRTGCRLMGENLGTVPREIERAMSAHKVGKMYVGQFSFRRDAQHAIAPPERNCVASLNTHDTPQFAQFLEADDVPQRVKLGVFSEALAEDETAARLALRRPLVAFLRAQGLLAKRATPDAPAIARGVLRFLAASDSEFALVNIEDLWGETRPQNIPGTSTEHTNWRHKARQTMDQIEGDPELARFFRDLRRLRDNV